MDEQKHNEKLKSGLVRFAAERGITPVQFAKTMGYQYATAWDLLRGKRPFTAEAFGRFSLSYGTHAAKKLLELAKIPDGIEDVSPLGEVDEGEIVPLVTVRSSAKLSKQVPKVKLRRAVVAEQTA